MTRVTYALVGRPRSTGYMVRRWLHRADTPTRVGDRVLWQLHGRFYDDQLCRVHTV